MGKAVRKAARRATSFSELTEDFGRLHVEAGPSNGGGARRAASARFTRAMKTPRTLPRMAYPFESPFGRQPIETTAENASNISMEDVSTTMALNAPALPPVPIYRGNTMADRCKFMRDSTRMSWLSKRSRRSITDHSRCQSVHASMPTRSDRVQCSTSAVMPTV